MPIYLEKLDSAGGGELQDLVKIYSDYPHELAANLLSPESWLEQQFSQQQLFVGRFNGRLLAAVWAKPVSGGWQLSKLCVRDITRRRGVARQLLQRLQQEADKQGWQLQFNERQEGVDISSLLLQLGFHKEQHWLYP